MSRSKRTTVKLTARPGPVTGHGGDVVRLARERGIEPAAIIDFSANLNPLGPPDWLREVLSRAISELGHYPDPGCTSFLEALSRRFDVPSETLVAGNGTSELIFVLPRVLEKTRALIPSPAYIDYRRAAVQHGVQVEEPVLSEEHGFAIDPEALDRMTTPDTVVFIGQPANPTGTLCDADALRWLAGRHPRAAFVVDEAYIDLVQGGAQYSLRSDRPKNIVVLYSLTKAFCIPGLRLGAAFASPELCRRLREHLPPWNVNALALAVGERALSDVEYIDKTAARVKALRRAMEDELKKILGLTVYPGRANFLLLRSEVGDLDAGTIAERLLDSGLAIRVCDNYAGLDRRYFRLAVRPETDTGRLLPRLAEFFDVAPYTAAPSSGSSSASRTRRCVRRARAIMVQGTGSNAGKSLLCAGLLRILNQRGIRAAPFKAQNMSLNSHVTREGGEMGRAQVLQAAACRLEPDVKMNPVLLKPNSETGSQVILLGKAVGHMGYDAYTALKADMLEKVHGSYDELAAEYEVMVIEGAGSPAEINLKPRDIVNMHMAGYADALVLLVGDIERGGIFASFVGTLELLTEAERERIAGFVINRFRGDARLLDTGIDYLQRRTSRPVLGCIPYLHDLGLPEEDSVSMKNRPSRGPTGDSQKLDVAVVDLPHISNFTDFDPLGIEPDVSLRMVRRVEELRSADMVIIPGSKNVLHDLDYLCKSGIASRVLELGRDGKAFCIGICGGFQMLGERICDPMAVETPDGKQSEALGLLPVQTTLMPEKTLALTRATHLPTGFEVQGYEIHHGRSSCDAVQPLWKNAGGEVIGVGSEDGRIWGTYLHGVFDDDGFRRWLIDRARSALGKPVTGAGGARFEIDSALDRLADTVRRHSDIERILKLVGIE